MGTTAVVDLCFFILWYNC